MVGSVQPPSSPEMKGEREAPPLRPCSPPSIGVTPVSSCAPPPPSHLLPSQHQRPSRLQRLSALAVGLGHCTVGGGAECEQGLVAWIQI